MNLPTQPGAQPKVGKRHVTTVTISSLLDAFRERPGDVHHAAGKVNVDVRTARRAWESGWPNRHDAIFHTPLKKVVEDEQRRARAMLEADARARGAQPVSDAVLSRDDGARQMADEAKNVRNVATAANALMSLAASAFPAMKTVVEQLVQDIKPDPVTGKSKLAGDPAAALKLLHRFTATVGKAAEVAERAQVMERRRLGKPTDVIGLQEVEPDDMDAQDIEQALGAAQRAFAIVKQHGLLGPASEAEVDLSPDEPAEG